MTTSSRYSGFPWALVGQALLLHLAFVREIVERRSVK
jgi:hypothetical protein